MKVAVLFLATTLLLAACAAPALGQVDAPLRQKVAGKADAATTDPAGYAVDQLTEERLADDANWTIAYGCYLGHEASDEAGLPPPPVERCNGFEEALGIAEEEAAQAEEVVADADELQDATRAEVEAIAEDLEDTLDGIVDDPGNALDALLGFVDRTVGALGRIIDDTLGDLGAGLEAGTRPLLKGAGMIVAAPVVGIGLAAKGIGDLVGLVADGTGTAIVTIGDATAAGMTTVADAVTETTRSTANGLGAWLQEAWAALLGDDVPADAPPTPDVPTPVDDTASRAADLLRDAQKLTEDATQATA